MRKYEWRIKDTKTGTHLKYKGFHFRFTVATWGDIWRRGRASMRTYQLKGLGDCNLIPNIRKEVTVKRLSREHWSTIGYTNHGSIQIRINPFY